MKGPLRSSSRTTESARSTQTTSSHPKSTRALRSLASILCLLVAVALSGNALAYNRTTTCDENDPRSPYACSPGQVPLAVAWNRRCVPFRLSDDIDPDGPIGIAIRSAFATWSDVACSYLQLQYAGTTDQRVVGYDRKYGEAGNFNVSLFRSDWASRPERIVGLTSVSYGVDSGVIYDADIEFNAEFFEFAVLEAESTTDPRMDMQNVATHEVGHFVGLDHTSASNFVGAGAPMDASMYIQTYPGELKRRTLADDDIAGICAIYPVEDAVGETCEALTPDFKASPEDFSPGRARESKKRGCGCTSVDEPGGNALLALLALGFGFAQRVRRTEPAERRADERKSA